MPTAVWEIWESHQRTLLSSTRGEQLWTRMVAEETKGNVRVHEVVLEIESIPLR